MSLGVIGYKARFYRGGAAPTDPFDEIPEVTSIDPPDPQYDEAEFTHLQSPGRTKEFKATFRDPGEVALEANYVPGNAVQEGMEADHHSGAGAAAQYFKHEVRNNDTDALLRSYVYLGYIKACKIGPLSTQDPVKFMATIRLGLNTTIT